MDVKEVTDMEELQINPKFKEAIPPLSEEEYENLRESVIAEGCRDSIIVWNGVIVDGHNRFSICREFDIPFHTFEKAFEDEEAVIEWIMFNQLSRRNLCDVERGRIALKLKELITARAKENQVKGGVEYGFGQGTPNLAQAVRPIQTRDELAKMAGLSHGTLAKIEKVDREAPPVIREAMGKTISIDRAAQLNAELQKLPEADRDNKAGFMFSAEYTKEMERLNREGRIMKKLHNIIASASMDYEYIDVDCVDVYIRRTPLSVESVLGTIDDQIKWLGKLKQLFIERNTGRGNRNE
jgi:ParB-like chromosome segregation protein Spo0J